ncbi:MAG: hypothetical protein ACRDTD_03765 [Pseudonocardiaceae bacterium]
MEWQAALRTDHAKLVTIRIDDCPLEGLLATITYLDLVGVTDPGAAQQRLLTRLRHALAGRAKPAREPVFPAHPKLVEVLDSDGDETLQHQPQAGHEPEQVWSPEPPRIRRIPQAPPSFPPAPPRRSGVRRSRCCTCLDPGSGGAWPAQASRLPRVTCSHGSGPM